ncbi:MAG TPA: hypothetical protein V6C78_04145 [Crinalium sp.]
MIILTPEEINQYRAELSENTDALRSLDLIEDCEGDIEDAAIVLALQAGQEPDHSDRWLEGQAKRWRAFLCQNELKVQISGGAIASLVQLLIQETTIAPVLAVPVIIYVLKTGVEEFCRPFEQKI